MHKSIAVGDTDHKPALFPYTFVLLPKPVLLMSHRQHVTDTYTLPCTVPTVLTIAL